MTTQVARLLSARQCARVKTAQSQGRIDKDNGGKAVRTCHGNLTMSDRNYAWIFFGWIALGAGLWIWDHVLTDNSLRRFSERIVYTDRYEVCVRSEGGDKIHCYSKEEIDNAR